jgi:surface antigen
MFAIRHRRGGASTLLALAGTLLALACATPQLASAASATYKWEPSASQFWAVNESEVMSQLQNGQCIQWAADKRPDIVRRGMEAIISQELAAGMPEDLGNWSAKYWSTYATLAGIPTGSVPEVGAIAVFQPGVLGASAPDGHVAYVQRVTSSGRAYISQMHAPALGKVTYRWLSARDARTPGITYIYR